MPVLGGSKGHMITSRDLLEGFYLDENGHKHALPSNAKDCIQPGDMIGKTGGWINGELVSTDEDIDDQLEKYGVGF